MWLAMTSDNNGKMAFGGNLLKVWTLNFRDSKLFIYQLRYLKRYIPSPYCALMMSPADFITFWSLSRVKDFSTAQFKRFPCPVSSDLNHTLGICIGKQWVVWSTFLHCFSFSVSFTWGFFCIYSYWGLSGQFGCVLQTL